MKTRTLFVGVALIAGVVSQSRPAHAEVCSNERFLSGLCSLDDHLRDEIKVSRDGGPSDAGPSDAGAATAADSGVLEANGFGGVVSPALPTGQKQSPSNRSHEGSSQDPTAAPNGETPATADQGEVGGGGGCTTAPTGVSTRATAAVVALGLCIGRLARRRRR